MSTVHRSVKGKRDCQAADQAGLLQCRPPIPPKEIRSQAIDEPGHATRLIAMQQPDKPYTSQPWQGGHWEAAKEPKHSPTDRTSWSTISTEPNGASHTKHA